jgi:cysteine dioxygenase
MKLPEFFAQLDEHPQQVPLDQIANLLERLELQLSDVQSHLEFNAHHYKRNLMHQGPSCQVLMLCWLNGQRSQIHDHVGSNCGVRVMRGTAIETTFHRADNGMIYASGSRALAEGSICANHDDDIHQVSNLAADDKCLVTLHVYSPPLRNMNVYDLSASQPHVVEDPVHELLYGGGSTV